jgi:hypothetical protein
LKEKFSKDSLKKNAEILEIKSSTNYVKTSMENITNRLNQAEEKTPRIEEQVEELLHSDSKKEKKPTMITTFKNCRTQLRENYCNFFEWKRMCKYRLMVWKAIQ